MKSSVKRNLRTLFITKFIFFIKVLNATQNGFNLKAKVETPISIVHKFIYNNENICNNFF